MSRFGSRTTVDQVLDGLDLSGRTVLVTGCASGIGQESMRALAARGARVVGTARSHARAAEACAKVGGVPIACDQDDFASVAAAAEAIRALGLRFDAMILNAGIMAPPDPAVRYGVEQQLRVNHLSHMLLATRLADLLVDGTGRLVVVSSLAQLNAPAGGIAWDALDGGRRYRPWTYYGQSKLANCAFAKSMAERLAPRGIVANALHPGVITGTGLSRSMSPLLRLGFGLLAPFGKSVAQGAATQTWLAAHPDAAGVSGGYFADCRPATPNALANDPAFRDRLWRTSETILAEHAPA